MVAITDGQLQSKINHEIRAVVECKKSERKDTDTMIAMQEAALLAAWIHEYSLHPSLRVLVSQGKVQLFITFARTPAEWLGFLKRNRTSTPRSFMRLYSFGPWDLTWANEVREAAAILLAIAK